MSLDLSIDRSSELPIYLQIRRDLERLIEDGTLQPGTRLPSTRELANRIGVNRNTVGQAYEAMARDGAVRSSVGQGTFVGTAESTKPQPVVKPSSTDPMDWEALLGNHSLDRTQRVLSTLQPRPVQEDAILFTKGAPDPALFPREQIGSLAREILSRQSSVLYDYGPPSGYSPLRELIHHRLVDQGLDPDRNEILIINGSTQGLDLVSRLLMQPGDEVGIEAPTYSGALNLFAMHEARCVPASVDNQGMVVSELAHAMSFSRLKLIYTMPRFHNPCGITMSRPRRTELLELARRHQIPVFEDDPEADLRFDGTDEPPLKAWDKHDCVITAGTFSKIAFPGFRIGWLAVPKPIFEPLLALKAGTDISSNLFAQVLFYEFLERGLLDEHVQHVLPVYKRRRDAMIEALETHLTDETTFTRPLGGLVLWLDLPSGVSAESLLRRTAARNVFFTPGRSFLPNLEREGLRLSFASAKRNQIERGISVLAQEIENEVRDWNHGPLRRPDLNDGLPLV